MGLMKKLTSSIVASSLVLGLVGTAFAAPTADATNNAFERLSHYNIAKGKALLDGTVDPALNDSITRAEMVTVITRAFGQDETAKILAGAASFNDVAANEWYSGYVALAKNIAEKKGFPIGYEDGTFQPNKQVSAVEALGFIMKYLGVKPATGANWAADTVKAAIEAGVITSADAEAYLADLNAPATRGLAFGLADTIFGSYNKLAGGKTVYTAFVDTQAPVVTLDKVEATTAATTKISGKVSGDYTEVYIGTEKITVNEDGTFAAEVKLTVGENTISVIAKDLAGNEGVGTVAVTRTAGAAAGIEATLGAAEIVAGGETELTIKVVDANGADVAVPAADIKVTSTLGTYADGKFTAGTKAGAGTITVTYGDFTKALDLKVVAGELAKVEAETASVAPGKAVKLVAKDANGNAIEGATFTEESADAFIDGNLFTATKAGQYTVKAMKGETIVEGAVGVFGAISELSVEVPQSFIANEATLFTVTVKAVDEAGSVLGDYDGAIAATLPAGFTDEDDKTAVSANAVNGVATFKLKGDATLADTETDLSFTTTYEAKDYTGKATILGVAQVATALKIDAPDYLPTNDPAKAQKVNIDVLDQVGKPMVDGAWSVSLKVTGPATFADSETTVDEIITASTDGVNVDVFPDGSGDIGSVGITASFTGMQTATATMKAAYAQAASRLSLTAADEKEITVADLATAKDSNIKFTVEAVDKNGVPTTIDAPTSAVIEFADASDTKTFISANGTDFTDVDSTAKRTIALTDGKADFYVASVKAGTFSVTATGSDMTKSSAISVATKAGDPTIVGFSSPKLNVLRSADATATFSAQLYDDYGNKAAVAGKEIKFTIPETAGVKIGGEKTEAKVDTDANGAAAVDLTFAQYAEVNGLNVTVAATDAAINAADGSDLLAGGAPEGSVAVTLTNRIAASVSVSVVDFDNTKRLSSYAVDSDADGIGLLATVKDNYGNAMDGLTGDDFAVTASDDTDVDTLAVTETATKGTYLITGIKPEKVGSVSFAVKVKTVATEVANSRTLSVRAGAPNTLSVAELSNDVVTIKPNTPTDITIIVTDAKGNQVSPASVTSDIEVSLGGTPATGAYLAYQDSKNLPITKVTIKAGTSSVKVKVVTDSEDAFKLTLTAAADTTTAFPDFVTTGIDIGADN